MSAIWFHKIELGQLVGKSVTTDTELSISELPRVAAVSAAESGPIHVRFGFENARNGIVLLDGELSGCIRVRCQRCLDEMDADVGSRLRLALLTRESQLESVPADHEPLIIPGGDVRVMDLIEDEILLTLPLAAKHTDDKCGPLNDSLKSLSGSEDPERIAPFASLAEMMRDGTD